MENKDLFVAKTSIIEKNAKIGKHTKIWNWVQIMGEVSIGCECKIGNNCFIESGVVIGNRVTIKNNVALYNGAIIEDDVFLGPNCVFTNVLTPRAFVSRKNEFLKTTIKKGATIGANTTIVCGVTIGEYAFIGAGSVVTKDIPPFTLCYGNPAKVHGRVCECGTKLIDGKICPRCKKVYDF